MDINQIIEDIKLFCDPFTDIIQKTVSGKKRLVLTRNARELTYDIDPDSGKISAKHRKAEYKSIKSLLASSEFADIKRFADTQKRYFSQEKAREPIDSEVNFDGKDILARNIDENINPTEGKISLILLDGPAGAGKTFQIIQLAKTQSNKFLTDNLSPPVLHISSSGRRLSNFKDVLAATTQDMGACFTGRHVPMLVRHGLLIAAVDGFDELVDADGYEDSWRALSEFIKEVGSSGKVILAARDTFLDEQELLERIDADKESIDLKLAHIKLTSPAMAIDYLSKDSKWSSSDLAADIIKDVFSEGSYALRPFFLSVLKESGGWSKIKSEGFRTFLVNNLVERESKILARTLGSTTADAIAPSLYLLFEEVALEMASRENNLIEIEHLAFLADYCFNEVLDENALRKLTHKAGSVSLLEISEVKDKRKFPHTEVQYYFLARALLKQLSKRTVPSVLRRTILSAEHLEVFAEVFTSTEKSTKTAMDFLYSAVNGESSNDSLPSNGGAMVLLSFAFGLIDRIDYLLVNDATFAGGTPAGTLQDVTISRLDVCGADISNVNFEKVKIGTLVVDGLTKFGQSLPEIDALEIRSDSSYIERNRELIVRFIEEHIAKMDPAKLKAHPGISLLEKVVRRSIRYCYLRAEGDDDEGSFMLRDEFWPLVKSILSNHGRIDIKRGKPMHGRPAALIRIKKPKDLLDFSLPETAAIIQDIMDA